MKANTPPFTKKYCSSFHKYYFSRFAHFYCTDVEIKFLRQQTKNYLSGYAVFLSISGLTSQICKFVNLFNSSVTIIYDRLRPLNSMALFDCKKE